MDITIQDNVLRLYINNSYILRIDSSGFLCVVKPYFLGKEEIDLVIEIWKLWCTNDNI
jgi:hypothetical protein